MVVGRHLGIQPPTPTHGMALQAISAAGGDPASQDWTQLDGSPIESLVNLQQENGAIGGDFTNAYSTADAILGLSGSLYNLSRIRRTGYAFEFILLPKSRMGMGVCRSNNRCDSAAYAAGWDPTTITTGNRNPLDYLKENLNPYLENGPCNWQSNYWVGCCRGRSA